ncbi:Phosphodiest-domain-containing protein [Stemphylium lycopersici]|uniref:Phosphodiest-domain-containing protein n=1 Tax=Stemphylium lycopersici TaxID=183478 RepID=A0A364NCW0_STELY|nr:Phosphodiest-domain-containing protein [Stemphylium lycopersici]
MADELLVHISAPTTRQSDELYQSLAGAYLEFEPLKTYPENARQTNASNEPALFRLSNPSAIEPGSSFQGTADTSILSTSRDSYGSFPSHLSSENAKSTADAFAQSYSDASEEDSPPPSSSRLSRLERIHRSGEGRRILRSSSAAGRRIVNQIPSSPDDADTGFIEDTQLADHDPPSQLQDSFLMISDDTSEDEPNRDQTQDDLQPVSEQDQPTDEGVTEVLVTATPDKSEAVPVRRRSMRLKGADSVAETPKITFSNSSTWARSAMAKAPEVQPESTPQAPTPGPKITKGGQSTPSFVQRTQAIDFAKLEIEVYPPEPKISTEQPGTLPCQITPTLAAIKAKDPTSFKPIQISKKPKPDDRGYWLVNCSNWTTQLQQMFWNNTCKQVASGQLGWGVTLYREGDESHRIAGSDAGTDERTLYDHTSDDEGYDGRPSGELSKNDHDILDSEDERERLLTQSEGGKGILGRKGSGVTVGKWVKDKTKARRKGGNGESSALMYEMEEGIGASSTSFRSRRSSESDEQRLLASESQRRAHRKSLLRRIGIYISIVILFVVLLAAAYNLSTPQDVIDAAAMVSNGTSLFAPTTILISLDGFRADFLYRNLTPTLNQFVQEGISPKYMMPSFPSVTFPNHYTIATGMYPEAHGVVGNTFWDPKLEQEFYYTDPKRSLQPHWWGGEPLWVTAEKQNVKAAVHMWPGSETNIQEQDIAYVDKYNGSEVLTRKVDRIMGLLDLPGSKDTGANATTPRPQLIAAYVPDVDADGHRYGPNSTEIRQTITKADSMLGYLLQGLHERNLTNIVNVVVVSDHGMATTDITRLVQLEDLIDPSELSHTDGWPLFGLRPKDPSSLHRMYNQLKNRTADNPNLDVYLRDEDMPERYHFSKNERIAPLWIVPKTGWAIVTKDEFDIEEEKKRGGVYHPRGLHGYDHEHPLMRAIFVARGPAFPHEPGSRMEPFQNIQIYNIICDSINVKPAPNNGTLRLPLKPVGLHNDDTDEASEAEEEEDPVSSYTLTSTSASTSIATSLPSSSPLPPDSNLASMSSTLDSLSSIAASASGLEDTAPTLEDPPSRPTPPSSSDGSGKDELKDKDKGGGDDEAEEEESWWEWMTHKADGVKDWVDGFIHDHVKGGKNGKGGKEGEGS